MTASPIPILAALIGQDLKGQDPSWAQAAGSAIATPEDITRWVRLLFQGNVLADTERDGHRPARWAAHAHPAMD